MEIKIKIDEKREINKNKFFFGNQYENCVNKVILDLPEEAKYKLYLFYYSESNKKDLNPFKIDREFYITRELTSNSGIYNAFIVSSDANQGENIFEANHVFISNEFKFEIKSINVDGGGKIDTKL